ncbi:glycine cleavage system protein GcvH [Fusibacter sp. JL216-2]|uniref:glycine cleavage system protein GcvH n=1 Tax=Fusibacter sp. JL216-2 TaxID=3071453 RepID=UPI003D33D29E
MKVLSGLYYSEDHEWVRVEGNIGYIGISDFAQHELGDIVYVELPDEDDEFEKGDSLGAIESVKAASDVLIPISGRVIEINDELEDAPEKVNEDAFDAWLIKVEISDEGELADLMNAEAYEKFIKEE